MWPERREGPGARLRMADMPAAFELAVTRNGDQNQGEHLPFDLARRSGSFATEGIGAASGRMARTFRPLERVRFRIRVTDIPVEVGEARPWAAPFA